MSDYSTAKNILFVSDLDGTLLNKSAEVSERTAATLNRLIAAGHNFTIATARTATSAPHMMRHVNCKIPFVLLNGVAIFDPVNLRYIHAESLQRSAVSAALDAALSFELDTLVYSYRDGNLTVHKYVSGKPGGLIDRIFADDLAPHMSGADFTRPLADIHAANDGSVVYLTFAGQAAPMNMMHEAAQNIPGVTSCLSHDVYSEDGVFVEIYDAAASKANGVKFLSEMYNFTRIIAFGDNTNDIEMLTLADEAYVPENGVDSAKNLATAVIDAHDNDGVARWLETHVL